MSSDPISKYDSHGLNFCTNHHDTYPFISPTSAPNALAGRYILVTGASKGIGRATAVSFARAGAAGIALLARSSLATTAAAVKEAAKAAGHAEPIVATATADVASKAEVAAAGYVVRRAFGGKLDALILNAGTLERCARILDQDPLEWWTSYSSSVLGSYVTLNVFLPLLRGTKGGLGTVVGTSSIGATIAGGAGISGTPTAKLALSRLMEFVNAEYGAEVDGSTGVLAYSIHPGAVDHPERTDISEQMHKMSIDTVELAADATTWLIRERRDWLAGRYISVNWDMEEFVSRRAQIEKRDLLKFRLAMGGEDWSKADES